VRSLVVCDGSSGVHPGGMEPGDAEQGWLIDFLGGPWDRQSGLYDREPEAIIDAPLEPPFRYRLAVKLGTGRPANPLQHLIYEAEQSHDEGPRR
jgi:hypothetical protein